MATFNGEPAASADDAFNDDNVGFDNSGTTLYVAPPDFIFETPEKTTWVRFPNVTVPSGATISAAKLVIVPTANVNTTGGTYYVAGFDEDNSAQVADSTDGFSRSITTAEDDGNFGSLTNGTPADSFDFTSVVAEIVARGGWASGNAMQFRITADTGGGTPELAFASYDHATYAAPQLDITYTAGGGGGGGTATNLLLLGVG